jgi:hypothetical protein
MKSYSLNSGFAYASLIFMIIIGFSACNTSKEEHLSNEEHLIIKEQGSFAVGGSVITNPGTFDAIERTPEGQTFHGDHAYAWLWTVFKNLGNHARWKGRISEHISSKAVPGLSYRSTPPRECGTQHG